MGQPCENCGEIHDYPYCPSPEEIAERAAEIRHNRVVTGVKERGTDEDAALREERISTVVMWGSKKRAHGGSC